MSNKDEDHVRARLPHAPEEAIKQIAAYDAHHRQMLASPRKLKSFEAMLLLFEDYLLIIQRWAPKELENEVARLVRDWGKIICKGNKDCQHQFESTIRDLVKLMK